MVDVRVALSEENDRLIDENKRLREAAHYATGTAQLAMQHRDEAEAEVKRLRAALQQIADGTDMGKLTSMQGTGHLITNVHVVARAALAQPTQKEE